MQGQYKLGTQLVIWLAASMVLIMGVMSGNWMSLVPVGMVAIPLLLMVGVIGFFRGRMFRLR